MHPEKEAAILAGHGKETTITAVTEYDNAWNISLDDHTVFGLSKEHGATPTVGDRLLLITKNLSLIIGVDINDEEVFFKTSVQLENEEVEAREQRRRDLKEKYLKEKEKLDEDYALLPQNFRRRIDIFRETNPDFRWEFESYEMFTCKEAIKIADYLKDHHHLEFPVQRGDVGELVKVFSDLSFEEQQSTAGIDDEHSGNTFGCALTLAQYHLIDSFTMDDDSFESLVVAQHGALVPLVGCDEYGCPHPRP
jgi:hypothetical protein